MARTQSSDDIAVSRRARATRACGRDYAATPPGRKPKIFQCSSRCLGRRGAEFGRYRAVENVSVSESDNGFAANGGKRANIFGISEREDL